MNKLKQCSICGEIKEVSFFSRNRRVCKICRAKQCKQWREENHDLNKEIKKQYCLKNKEKIREYVIKTKDKRNQQRKKWRLNNKDKVKAQAQKDYNSIPKTYLYKLKNKERINTWLSSPAIYKTHKSSLEGIEHISEDGSGFLMVQCKKCFNFFTPTNNEVRMRRRSLNSNKSGECNFYCSEECKFSCPIYRKIKHIKGNEPKQNRETSFAFNKIVFEERNKECEKCGSKENLQIHHIKGYALFPELRFDLNNVLLLCKECHKDIHKKNDCKTNQLKCNKQGE